MSTVLRGIGTAQPPGSISQQDAAEVAWEISARHKHSLHAMRELYRLSGVQTRATALTTESDGIAAARAFYPPAAHAEERGPRTAERMQVYAREAPLLALRAATAALSDAGADPLSITHLVTVSCTGFVAPGIDHAVIEAIGLSPRVQRTHVGFMGCHGALNGLCVADAFARSQLDAQVLLIAVELCTLHYSYRASSDLVVSNALFSDGAAALVCGAASGERSPLASLVSQASVLLPNSREAMGWVIGDHGFEMRLSARVPKIIERHVGDWVRPWLATRGLSIETVGAWAVHPGGPRILDAVRDGLSLPEAAMEPSRSVLAGQGNMSSPTVIFILERLRRLGAPRPWCVLGFGPGLTCEALLLD